MPYSWGATARSPPAPSHLLLHPQPLVFPTVQGSHPYLPPLPSTHAFKARKATPSKTADPREPLPQDMARAIFSAAQPAPSSPQPQAAGWDPAPTVVSLQRDGRVLPRREAPQLPAAGRYCCAQPVSAETHRAGAEGGHQAWEPQEEGLYRGVRAPRATGHQDPPTPTRSFGGHPDQGIKDRPEGEPVHSPG